jgi:hypothetical protein
MGGMIAQIVATKHSERSLSLTSIMAGAGNPGLPPVAKPDEMSCETNELRTSSSAACPPQVIERIRLAISRETCSRK